MFATQETWWYSVASGALNAWPVIATAVVAAVLAHRFGGVIRRPKRKK